MFDFDALLPKNEKLDDYQTVGVATLLLERRAILADEMGLGKTVQALVTLEAAQAYPAIVACPAMLKGEWAYQVQKFLPERTFCIASKAHRKASGADITIVPYSILADWLEVYSAPMAVVFDESHYALNLTARRTKAALSLAKRVPEEGLVLAVSGTPFDNHPVELATTLQLIGRLHQLAPEPEGEVNDERAWRKSFAKEWCKDKASLRQLHRVLAQTCLVRRTRAVIGRKPTQVMQVHMSVEGALQEYREAEADLLSYLLERDGVEAAARAMRMEALSKLAHLRRLLGEAKVWAAQQWIDNFLGSNPSRSLVVFAHHKSVQEALVQHYECAHLLGSEPDPEEQKRRFQEGETRLIVCSLTAAREGHTLTAAHDVLFVELPWTPGAFDQASSRVNRRGQVSTDTFAWVLLAEGTIDLRILEIIETKRELFKAVMTSVDTAKQVMADYVHKIAA